MDCAEPVEIDQLTHFVKVAELQNFTRAATELGLSQSAVSRSIQRLEQEVGQPLLERRTRSVALTDAGRLLQSRAHQILRIIEDTKNEITDDGRSGRLRLGAIPTVAPFFLPGLLTDFTEAFPDATATVQEDTTNNLVKRVKRVAFGFRRFANYRIRTLLYAGRPNWDLLPTVIPR